MAYQHSSSLLLATILGLLFCFQVSSAALCGSGQVDLEGACVPDVGTDSCSFSNVTTDSTVNPPYLLNEKVLSNDDVTLTILQPFTRGRTVVGLELSSLDVCNYPSLYWSKDTVTDNSPVCSDLYRAVIPWNIAYNASSTDQELDGCGLIRNETETTIDFYGEILVTYEDLIQIEDEIRPFNLTRTSKSALGFRLSFPKNVEVSASLAVSSDPRVLSAVTQQVYNVNSGSLQVKVFTSVQAPFRLASIDAAVMPTNIDVPAAVLDTDCPVNENVTCNQVWTITVSRISPKCDFTGNFIFSFETVCQSTISGTPSCPIDANGYFNNVTFGLLTEDVCARVDDLTEVTAALAIFGEYDLAAKSFSTPKLSFFSNQPVYFRLTLTSNGATFSSSTINTISALTAAGAPASIVTNQVAVVNSYGSSMVSTSALVRVHEFHFTFDPSWFGRVPTDGSVGSTITVSSDLAFANTNAKRSVRAVTAERTAKTSASVAISASFTPDNSAPVANSGSSISYSFVYLAAIAMLIFVIV